ncbi:hypothetical protein F4780DRAFT_527890 [Xylariomycetidae sp. FL0641]|nr:hypothetical protein F4780DRAFT_527890 [Xylariomycetidae sp. FL0641]
MPFAVHLVWPAQAIVTSNLAVSPSSTFPFPFISSATMNALHKVLNTPELLEAILLQLDLRTLLVSASRVNHYFRDVISQVALQKALFFAPDTRHDVLLNPLLLDPFQLWYKSDGPNFIKSRGYTIHSFRDVGLWGGRNTKAFMRRGASWRRMLVQQPPVTTLTIVTKPLPNQPFLRDEWGDIRLYGWTTTVDVPQGLTMGMLYDLTHQRLAFTSLFTAYYFHVVRNHDQPGGSPENLVYEERGCEVFSSPYGIYSTDFLSELRHPDARNIHILHPAFDENYR